MKIGGDMIQRKIRMYEWDYVKVIDESSEFFDQMSTIKKIQEVVNDDGKTVNEYELDIFLHGREVFTRNQLDFACEFTRDSIGMEVPDRYIDRDEYED